MATIMKVNDKAIRTAAKILHGGGIVIYPTESSYGIAADATNSKAIKKIFAIKKRPHEKNIPIIVADKKMASRYLLLTEDHKKLLRLMPGPLTLTAQKKFPAKYLGGFRISSNKAAEGLSKRLGKPLTATSANISGRKPLYRIKDVIKTFGSVDLIIDSGDLPKRIASTVFSVEERKIIRKGPITKKEILSALKN